MANSTIPLSMRRVALINLLFVSALLWALSYKMTMLRLLVAGVMMYGAGMLDFAVTYWSIRQGAKAEPEKALQLMRKGMGIRVVLALVATVLAIKYRCMPWAILLGLLITHVVVLIDSIRSSGKFRSS